MNEQIISPVKIIKTYQLTAADLDLMITYTGGADAAVLVIKDNRAFAVRDRLLDKLACMRSVLQLDRVFPDPTTADIMEMADTARSSNVSVVLGIGGGSAMDSAKAVSLVLSNGGHLEDYLGPGPSRTPRKKEYPLILIPTTCGTGSEVTRFGVYTSASGRKYTLNTPLLHADVCVLDHAFISTLPPALVAATGFDALSHALETLWNKNATEVSDAAGISAAVMVLASIEEAYHSAQEGKSGGLQELLEAACKAGIAFNLTGTAAVHALSFILGETWHVPHGAACAFTLDDIMNYNMQDPGTVNKLSRIAGQLFPRSDDPGPAEKLRKHIVKLKKKLGLPVFFKDLGLALSAGEIQELFKPALSDPKMNNNIVPLAMKDITRILHGDALKYR